MFTQKKESIEVPVFYNEYWLKTLKREQLIEHALKMTEYAQKLEGKK